MSDAEWRESCPGVGRGGQALPVGIRSSRRQLATLSGSGDLGGR
jgi:hypothetical protein